MPMMIHNRGDCFRREFSKLGEVRSLIPANTKVMALTATATVKSRNNIIKIMGMCDPVIVSESPEKSNLIYRVQERTTINSVFMPLVETLRKERIKTPRVIIFCRQCEECATLYEFFLSNLNEEFTEPVGAPNLSRYRLVDMFMSATDQKVKDSIIDSFCTKDQQLRIVICTIAFGMGVDCINVRQIVHWGVASDVESYVQESGRAGRDGKIACATIFFKKSDLDSRRVNKDMIEYCRNVDQCRRSLLFSHFDNNLSTDKPQGCVCCDVCALSCQCDVCMCSTFPV